MKKEYKSKKKMLYAVLFQTGLAYLMASGIYLIGSLIGVMF
jgi:Fe2+ transport system protein B